MKVPHVVIIGICLTVFAFASCKKKHSPSVSDDLVGKWQPIKNAVDNNGNGIMDPSEVYPDTTDAGILLVFNSNGTLSVTYLGIQTEQLTWSLANSNAYLKINDTSLGGSITYDHIDNISSTSLTLRDTTGGIATWIIFAKQ